MGSDLDASKAPSGPWIPDSLGSGSSEMLAPRCLLPISNKPSVCGRRAESPIGMPESKSPPFLITIINTLPVSPVCLLLGVYVAARNAVIKDEHTNLEPPVFSLLCVPPTLNALVLDENRRGGNSSPHLTGLPLQSPC